MNKIEVGNTTHLRIFKDLYPDHKKGGEGREKQKTK